MKQLILSFTGIFLFTGLFSQLVKPENMVFVPMGSFSMRMIEQNDTIEKIVSLQAFYMSNEVTNKEYREFVNDIKTRPDDSLCWIDYDRARKNNEDLKNFNRKKYITCVKNSGLIQNIIDTTVWQKAFSGDKTMRQRYVRYFYDPSFDNYPVVGVSHKNAVLYCIWKTNRENEQLRKKGEAMQNDYRLPTEAEWAYYASLNQYDDLKEEKTIQPVNKGTKDKLGLYHIPGNVSEWTSVLMPDDQSFMETIRGGSWQTNQDVTERKTVDRNTTSCDIGFRIVMTFYSKK